MSEQVVVICSRGEQRSAIDLCSTLERQGLTCWSPAREEDPDAALWTLPSKARSARAMVVVTTDASEHAEVIESVARHNLPVIVTPPDGVGGSWDGVMRQLADVLGDSGAWLSRRSTSPGSQPKVTIAEDEEEFIEFIAEGVSEAQVFVRFGLYDRAVDRLKKVFAKAPRNLEAHDELLKIFIEEEDWTKAAAAAADFLDCLRFRGDGESYAILRTHLTTMGFAVDDGPPVAVGYDDVEPVPTRFIDPVPKAPPAPAAPRPAVPAPAAAAAPPRTVPHEAPPLELPAIRNFRATQPVFQTSGIDSELNGIDFFIDHGMLDEARMRIDQLFHENPTHPGVIERRARVDALGIASVGPTMALELDDPWTAASKVVESDVDSFFGSAPPAAAPEPVPAPPQPQASPATGPIGEGASLICTAFVPERVEPGDMFMVRVCVYTAAQSDSPLVDSLHDRRESNMLARNVVVGETLECVLRLPGLEIDEDRLRLVWRGEPDSVEFGAVVPFSQSPGTVTGTLSIRTAGGPAGDFSFTLPVS